MCERFEIVGTHLPIGRMRLREESGYPETFRTRLLLMRIYPVSFCWAVTPFKCKTCPVSELLFASGVQFYNGETEGWMARKTGTCRVIYTQVGRRDRLKKNIQKYFENTSWNLTHFVNSAWRCDSATSPSHIFWEKKGETLETQIDSVYQNKPHHIADMDLPTCGTLYGTQASLFKLSTTLLNNLNAKNVSPKPLPRKSFT